MAKENLRNYWEGTVNPKYYDVYDNRVHIIGGFFGGKKELWDKIKPLNPTLLSAPSRDPQSRWGKRIWVKKNIPGTPLILAAAEAKKNYAKKNAILIDDRVSNINDWNKAGGIGILHTSTATTLDKLSKYGI